VIRSNCNINVDAVQEDANRCTQRDIVDVSLRNVAHFPPRVHTMRARRLDHPRHVDYAALPGLNYSKPARGGICVIYKNIV